VTLELASKHISVKIIPSLGGRVQRIHDCRSDRELLYQRRPRNAGTDFLAATTGGWDVLFPNDEPWRDHPDHGRVWTTPMAPVMQEAARVELRASLRDPAVDVTRRIALLDRPRVGVREELTILAREETEPFLVASHPMLAVRAGWMIELDDIPRGVEVDADFPGRFRLDRPIGESEWRKGTVVPVGSSEVVEVLYVDGVRSGALVSPDGTARTRVAWDPQSLPHLWICTISGLPTHRPFVILEPSTSRPYRLEEAITAGSAVSLEAGTTWTSWTEVESLDAPSSPAC
jgi:hypothetical protein